MNHYVMNAQSQMLHRGTLEDCRQWAEKQIRQYRSYGMRIPVYRVFYDTATEPTLTLPESDSGHTAKTLNLSTFGQPDGWERIKA